MIELTRWLQATRFDEKPWLLLGKGPTLSYRHDHDLTRYNLLGLNHVVAEMKVDIAHIIDVDVAEACADRLYSNARWLLMPATPHVQNRPSFLTLEDFVSAVPALRQLDSEGRLVWYNAETGKQDQGSPTISVRYFSSEAAIDVLALMGVKVVRSLGIDGGRGYDSPFTHLQRTTMLANSQPSFDLQFAEIERVVRKNGMDYKPLVEPIRVFVGVERADLLAARVLEHSIKANTKHPVRFIPMLDVKVPMPVKRRNRPRTGFSFCRFLIPELCRYEGRAIYLDSDMQVFGDIAELWNAPLGDHSVLCTTQDTPPAAWKNGGPFHSGPQMSVLLLNCSKLKWNIDEIVRGLDEEDYTYEQLMFDLCIVEREELGTHLPIEWNHLERFEPGTTKLLHYTVVPTQPWKNDDNSLLGRWMEGFESAVAAGAISLEEVEQFVGEGLAKESLAARARALAPETAPVSTSSVVLELAAARARVDALEAGIFQLWWHRLKRLHRDGRYLWCAMRRRRPARRTRTRRLPVAGE
jgi:hypothetical protein